ncbi:hypothetical protein [Flavobacterium gelatinilyticum]|uniref:hypothetical protein n=1 Tax=Flavobacterium gelatinilyticum TaxID=3003260 RepID=UPI00248120F2|nr:hypothetical protein [Flavobacterium gelatinilyticum]
MKNQIIEKLVVDFLDIQIEGEYITVAELKTIEKNGLKETIDVNTSIISNSLVNKIRSSHLNPYINRSSVNYEKGYDYKPSFWLYLSKSSGLNKAEPLVVSWCSGNHTTFCIDQGFLGTYYLTPRLLDKEIMWDDLKKPNYDVVINKLVSHYDFKHSEAFVKIKVDYLKDYLSLRKKTALQVFTLKREIFITNEISLLLRNEDYYVEEFKQFEIRIQRFQHKENYAHLEINGYRALFNENPRNFDDNKSIAGHYWEGIEGLVTQRRARFEMPYQYIYVLDEILAKYETDDDYEINFKSGTVTYANQWAVNCSERIGKNAIKIELKKLYEGTSFEIIDFWNKYSIDKSKIIEGENITLKAERLIQQYFIFGNNFSDLFNNLLGMDLTASDIVTIDENYINDMGYLIFSDYKPIAHHINFTRFSKEQFISRCKKLYIILGENLKEKTLRKIIDSLDFPVSITKSHRSLKLLELAFAYLKTVNESGLNPIEDKAIIVERVLEIEKFDTLTKLFALNDIRQIDSHKTSDSKSKLNTALMGLGIKVNSITNNYAQACEQTYDNLGEMFNNVNILLTK